jgi:hypothetical protein
MSSHDAYDHAPSSVSPKAAPEQVWKSTDKRQERWVRVQSVSDRYAHVRRCGSGGEWVSGGRNTRVQLDTLGRLTGYQLDVEATKNAPVWF